MNKETYEALKRIVGLTKGFTANAKNWKKEIQKDIKQVETWIDEVAKKYEEEIFTPILNGVRQKYQIKEVKIIEGYIGRGNNANKIMAKVEIQGKKYKVIQRSCGLSNCMCDAEIVEI